MPTARVTPLLRLAIVLPTAAGLVPSTHLTSPRRRFAHMASESDEELEGTLIRLDKLLAERGAGSRKDVDRMIRKGLVELDGEIVPKAGAKMKVRWESAPWCDGFDYPPPPLLVAYHKPLGVVSSMRDDRGRLDLSAVLPQPWQKLLHPVGRLDADTTGLLLFCRSGDLTHRLLHPKYVVEREYVAEVENPIDEAELRQKLTDGAPVTSTLPTALIHCKRSTAPCLPPPLPTQPCRRHSPLLPSGVETTEDGESLVVQAQLLDVDGQKVRLTVTEGKYRMVRRILANCGHPVAALHRERYGEVWLNDLEQGDSVAVGDDELKWALGLKVPPTALCTLLAARHTPPCLSES